MPEDLEILVTEFRADIRRYEAALRRQVTATERAARQTERRWNRANRQIEDNFDRTARNVRRAIAALAVGVAGREALRAGDAFVELGNKIAAAAQISGFEARSLDELQASARGARSALAPYVDLYSRLLRVGPQVARNELEIARVTEISNKAFIAGGAAAQERAAGILQLGQALGSGLLAGDELRSIRENAPLIAQAIADEFETTIGGLKKLGEEGELTSDRVFRAILRGGAKIEAAFDATVIKPTDAARLAFDRLRLKVGEYVQESGGVADASRSLGAAIDFVADNVDAFADAMTVAGAALTGALGAAALLQITKTAAGLARTRDLLAAIAFFSGRAAGGMAALALASRAVGGPIVVAAGLLAAAVALIGVNAESAEQRFAEFDRTLAKHGETLKTIAQDEERLAALETLLKTNENITEAIRAQGFASREALLAEIGALDQRIAKNKELLAVYETQLVASVAAGEAAVRQRIADAPVVRDLRRRRSARQPSLPGEPVAARLASVEVPEEEGLAAISARFDELNQKRLEGVRLTEREVEELETIAELRKLELKLASDRAALDALGDPDIRVTGVKRTDLTGTGASDKELAVTKNLVAEIDSAWRDLFESQLERIRRERNERIDALEDSVLTAEQKAAAERRINEIADEKIRRLKQDQADFEIGLINDVVEARDRVLGRVIAIAQREFDARAAEIEREIQNEERRNAALAALAEERAEFERQARAQLPGRFRDEFSDEAEIARVLALEAEKLAAIQEAFEARLIAQEDFEQRRRNIIEQSEREIQEIRNRTLEFQLRTTESTFGKLADLARGYAGEQSGIFRALFAVHKAAAVAGAIVATHEAVAKALASAPPPANYVQAGIVAAAGAAEVASILAAGFARGGEVGRSRSMEDGGRVFGPGTSTSDSIPARLSRGEFVVRASEAQKHIKLLEDINAGRLGAAPGFQHGGLVSRPTLPNFTFPNLAGLQPPPSSTVRTSHLGGVTVNIELPNVTDADSFRQSGHQAAQDFARSLAAAMER